MWTCRNFKASAKALAQANNVKLIDGYGLRNEPESRNADDC
jgi:hypothetical protein